MGAVPNCAKTTSQKQKMLCRSLARTTVTRVVQVWLAIVAASVIFTRTCVSHSPSIEWYDPKSLGRKVKDDLGHDCDLEGGMSRAKCQLEWR